MNRGANTGISVFYSGTVAAAREGVINGVHSMAVSLCSKTFQDFGPSVEWTAKLLNHFGIRKDPPLLLNVSIPPLSLSEIKGLKFAKVAPSRFVEEFVRFEPSQLEKESGVRHYQLAGGIHLLAPDGTSDEELIREGWVTMSPLSIEQTDYAVLENLKKNFKI